MNDENGILYVSDDAARPEGSRHNYAAQLEALQQAGGLKPGRVYLTATYHDDNCSIWRGGYCDCKPVIGPAKDVTPAAPAEPPQALAELSRGRDCWIWTVKKCPLCGRRHTHGGGPLEGNPRELLSHRVAHCVSGDKAGGYVLVEAPAGEG
jgi:hypothetical protein